MSRAIDLTGMRYGRLKVIKQQGSVNRHAAWLCECECGNRVVKFARHLKRGSTKSCGCLKSETSMLNCRKLNRTENTRFPKFSSGTIVDKDWEDLNL
jgi:hypothetical protein